MKSKKIRFISSGVIKNLFEEADAHSRVSEIMLEGKTILVHREDGSVEIWVENKPCKYCKRYHNGLSCTRLNQSN